MIAFYAIGLPVAWFLCFTCHFGVRGLMSGIAFGTLFQVVVLLVLILGFEGYVYAISSKGGAGSTSHKIIKFTEEEEDDNESADMQNSGHLSMVDLSKKNAQESRSPSRSTLRIVIQENDERTKKYGASQEEVKNVILPDMRIQDLEADLTIT